MKRIVILALCLVVVVIVGILLAALTRDVDRLRPVLVRRAEDALGVGVRLGRLSLGWEGGIAVQADGLAVYADRQASGGPLVQADQIRAVVGLGPLVRRELHVSAVTLVHPQFAVGGRMVALRRLALQFTVTPQRLELHRGVATLAEGTVVMMATMDRQAAPPSTTFQANATGVSLGPLLPAEESSGRRFQGRLEGSLQGTFRGLTTAEVFRTLSAKGTGRLEEVRIEGFNLLREVLQRLSVLPGLVESLEQRLPASSQAKLAEPSTRFEPIALTVIIADGRARLQETHLATDLLELSGSGWIDLSGQVEFPSTMSIEPELSSAMIRGVNELQALANPSGRLQFPVTLVGQLPHVTPVPDVQYVASKVVVTRAQELIGELLHKALGPDGQ